MTGWRDDDREGKESPGDSYLCGADLVQVLEEGHVADVGGVLHSGHLPEHEERGLADVLCRRGDAKCYCSVGGRCLFFFLLSPSRLLLTWFEAFALEELVHLLPLLEHLPVELLLVPPQLPLLARVLQVGHPQNVS